MSHSPPAFVGRRAELDLLEAGFASAAAGEPQLVLLAGETGIGKSRLLEEFLGFARARGALALVGNCPIISGREIPHAPLVSVLRSLRSHIGATEFDRLIPSTWELARLASPNGSHFDGDDAGSRVRQYEQLLTVFTSLGATKSDVPLVVAFEDLHWADGETLDLLAYLMRALSDARVLIVATYRDTDLGPDSPLRRVVLEAIRLPSVRHVEVGPLPEEEAIALVIAQSSQPADEGHRDRVVARAAGNPLFLEHLARTTADNLLPSSLATLLRAGLADLSSDSAQVLALAAVAGTRTPATLIEECAAAFVPDVIGGLSALLAANILELVREGETEFYVFRHPLVQEIVYADMVPARRRELHQLLAAALAKAFGAGEADAAMAVELARHWWSTGDRAAAYPWQVRAADAVASQFAFDEAHRLYERALAASPVRHQDEALPATVIGNVAPTGVGAHRLERRQLLERAAQAASLAGKPDRAVEIVNEAIRVVGTVAGLLGRRAQYLWEAGRRPEALATFEEAIPRLSHGTPERAFVLRSAARTYLQASQYERARDLAVEAIEAAGQAGDRVAVRHGQYTLAAALAHLGDAAGAATALDAARPSGLTELREPQQPRASRIADSLAGYLSRATVLSAAGQAEDAADAAMEGLRQARKLGVEPMWTDVIGASAVRELIELGRWSEAHGVIDDAARRSPGVGAPELRLLRARLLAYAGRHAEAQAEIGSVRGAVMERGVPRAIGLLALVETELLIGTAHLVEAGEVVELALAQLGSEADRAVQLELLGLALRAAADRAISARARRQQAEIADIEGLGSILHGQLLVGGSDMAPPVEAQPRIAALRAQALLEHGRLANVAPGGQWLALADQWRVVKSVMRCAYAEWRAAEAILRGRGSSGEARALLASAHATTLRLGADPMRREIEMLASAARVDLEAPEHHAPGSPPPGADDAGLTPRELEVISLVAQGKTNRQIAAALVISEKTAGHHVSNILAKLGARSRVEAASFAIQANLHQGDIAVATHVTRRADASEPTAPDRLTLTLMFTDIVRSTALLEAIGDDAWGAVVSWHDTTLRGLFAAYAGHEVDHAGDGFFVTFGSAVAALDCAIAIQRTLAKHRTDHGFAPSVRIAVHTAEVSRRGNGVQGRGVHLAARIAAATAAGEILASADSLDASDHRYLRLEPRQIEASGFAELLPVIPIAWDATGRS